MNKHMIATKYFEELFIKNEIILEGNIITSLVKKTLEIGGIERASEVLSDFVELVIDNIEVDSDQINLDKWVTESVNLIRDNKLEDLLFDYIEELEPELIKEYGDNKIACIIICHILENIYKMSLEDEDSVLITREEAIDICADIAISDLPMEKKNKKIYDIVSKAVEYNDTFDEDDLVDEMLADIHRVSLEKAKVKFPKGIVKFFNQLPKHEGINLSSSTPKAQEIWKPKFQFGTNGISKEQHEFNLEQIRIMIEDLDDSHMATRYVTKIISILKEKFGEDFARKYLNSIILYAKKKEKKAAEAMLNVQ